MERFSVVLRDHIERLDAVVSNLKPHCFGDIQLSFMMGFRDLLATVLKYADGEIEGEAEISASPSSLKRANGDVPARVDIALAPSQRKASTLRLYAEIKEMLSGSLSRWGDGSIAVTICDGFSAALQKLADTAIAIELDLTLSPSLRISAQAKMIDDMISIAMRGAILMTAAGEAALVMDVDPSKTTIGKNADALLSGFISTADVDTESHRFGEALLDLVCGGSVSGSLRLGTAIDDIFHVLMEINAACAKVVGADPLFTRMGVDIADTLVVFRRVYELDGLIFGAIGDTAMNQLDYAER